MKAKSKSQLLTELVDARIELAKAIQKIKHLQHELDLCVEIVDEANAILKETEDEYKKMSALYNEHKTIVISSIMKSQSN